MLEEIYPPIPAAATCASSQMDHWDRPLLSQQLTHKDNREFSYSYNLKE